MFVRIADKDWTSEVKPSVHVYMKNPANSTIHATTLTPAELETTFKDGAYRIDCSVCGTVATYAGQQFTLVEANAHARYFNTEANLYSPPPQNTGSLTVDQSKLAAVDKALTARAEQ